MGNDSIGASGCTCSDPRRCPRSSPVGSSERSSSAPRTGRHARLGGRDAGTVRGRPGLVARGVAHPREPWHRSHQARARWGPGRERGHERRLGPVDERSTSTRPGRRSATCSRRGSSWSPWSPVWRPARLTPEHGGSLRTTAQGRARRPVARPPTSGRPAPSEFHAAVASGERQPGRGSLQHVAHLDPPGSSRARHSRTTSARRRADPRSHRRRHLCRDEDRAERLTRVHIRELVAAIEAWMPNQMGELIDWRVRPLGLPITLRIVRIDIWSA